MLDAGKALVAGPPSKSGISPLPRLQVRDLGFEQLSKTSRTFLHCFAVNKPYKASKGIVLYVSK